jgi:hypothetical protein
MCISYAIEAVAEVQADIGDLIREHYAELTHDKDRIDLAPDFERYQALEDAGKLAIFTVRDDRLISWESEERSALVGYAIFFIDQHIHYKNQSFANNDIIFLDKNYRTKHTPWTVIKSRAKAMLGIKKKTSSIGSNLIDFSEEQLKLMGVTKVIWHIKFSLDWSAILKRRGYHREDFTLGKVL